ncbi:anaerobic c4-dicarboxylate membrane transporter family protein [Vibrio cholerae]|nr:anaerobic c4-dicarboxylate membrane transporter family protein [Vibrio cholerae]
MLYIGSRYGGIGLGVVSGIGLVIEVFVFKMPPTSPPITVMLIILAVVTCASILEAAGGLKYMLQVAERMLRKNPKRVTLIAPFVTYTMTFMLGTGHAVYSIMPIIGDVALKNGIRPERPMAAASVASQIAITASPISAAVVYYLAELANINHNITLLSILMVTIPATFLRVKMIVLAKVLSIPLVVHLPLTLMGMVGGGKMSKAVSSKTQMIPLLTVMLIVHLNHQIQMVTAGDGKITNRVL